MIEKLKRWLERDTEGRLRLGLAATRAALRDAVRERDAWRCRVGRALDVRLDGADALAVAVEEIERVQAKLIGMHSGNRDMAEAVERWRERVEPAEARAAELAAEVGALRERLEACERNHAQAIRAAVVADREAVVEWLKRGEGGRWTLAECLRQGVGTDRIPPPPPLPGGAK